MEDALIIAKRVLERKTNNDLDTAWIYARKGNSKCNIYCKRLQKECYKKEKKLDMCFVDMEKALERVPKKVMKWAMKKKFIRSNRLSSYEFVSWSKNKSEGMICIFRRV